MNTTTAPDFLDALLMQRLPADQYDWLQERLNLLHSDDSLRDIHITFGLIPRRLGRQDLAASSQDNATADAIVNGWNLSDWSLDMAARVLLLCRISQQTNRDFAALFKSMCQTADLSESICLYRGTALYPQSDELDKQIGEGLRTNMRAVFEAIAHHNPYPAKHFSELRWNHMVLKALFVDSTLHPIQGLDERANPELARILCDYAHERWSAHRPVTPELWRCVGPFARGSMLDDLQKVLESGLPLEHQGAVLALSRCPDPRAEKLLANYPEQVSAVANEELSWDSIIEQTNQPG
ncbi:EboA domain-containing protein [Granulosicoccus sp. 3-233]|uniref:EboA domain-containing protein n=1 Tax=Granulosicoccus sp. 3-233 TaxID=3417969 RepID=UPI003D34DC0B